MKILLASEAMECCAKAIDGDEATGNLSDDGRQDARAIYQAAAVIFANFKGEPDEVPPQMPVPTWLAKAGGYGYV